MEETCIGDQTGWDHMVSSAIYCKREPGKAVEVTEKVQQKTKGMLEKCSSLIFVDYLFLNVWKCLSDAGRYLNLKSLQLVECEGLSDDGVGLKLDEGTVGRIHLTRISLCDAVLEALPRDLQEIVIEESDATNQGIKALPKGLLFLKISKCPKVNIKKLGLYKLFPNLQNYEADGTYSSEVRVKLERRVLGQPMALAAAERAIVALKAGVNRLREGPPPILFFGGMTGVGKTELAEAIAEVTGRKLVKFDMSHFQKDASVWTLMGSAKGYSGSTGGGQLPNAIKANPQAVVLLDEIEKAAEGIHTALLGIFDKGVMTDALDRKINCRQTLFVLTSNLGAEQIAKLNWNHPEEALEKTRKIIIEGLKKIKPEYAGRLAESVVPFRPFTQENLRGILRHKASQFTQTMGREFACQLTVTEDYFDHLLGNVASSELGVRPAFKLFQKEITECLGRLKVDGQLAKGQRWELFVLKSGRASLRLANKSIKKGVVSRLVQRDLSAFNGPGNVTLVGHWSVVRRGRDDKERHLIRRAIYGDVNAQFEVGALMIKGRSESDAQFGLEFLRCASKKNNSGAWCELGWCYEKGVGVPQNFKHAHKYYKKAGNHAQALWNLAALYENGLGIANSRKEAKKLREDALNLL